MSKILTANCNQYYNFMYPLEFFPKNYCDNTKLLIKVFISAGCEIKGLISSKDLKISDFSEDKTSISLTLENTKINEYLKNDLCINYTTDHIGVPQVILSESENHPNKLACVASYIPIINVEDQDEMAPGEFIFVLD